MTTIEEMDDLMRRAGFAQTEAAGLFRWWQLPGVRRDRSVNMLAIARVQFYGGRSDLQAWVANPNWSHARRSINIFNGYVETPREAEGVVASAIEARMRLAVDEMLRENDPRVTQFPELFRAAYADPVDNNTARRVLVDALLDHGVAF